MRLIRGLFSGTSPSISSSVIARRKAVSFPCEATTTVLLLAARRRNCGGLASNSRTVTNRIPKRLRDHDRDEIVGAGRTPVKAFPRGPLPGRRPGFAESRPRRNGERRAAPVLPAASPARLGRKPARSAPTHPPPSGSLLLIPHEKNGRVPYARLHVPCAFPGSGLSGRETHEARHCASIMPAFLFPRTAASTLHGTPLGTLHQHANCVASPGVRCKSGIRGWVSFHSTVPRLRVP